MAIHKQLNYKDAETECERASGKLASVHSSEENTFIFESLTKEVSWLGGNDMAVEGTWIWTDNTQWSYSNWARSEPNNYGGFEHCLVIGRYDEKWNDHPCGIVHEAICKRGKESQIPVTFLLPPDFPFDVS